MRYLYFAAIILFCACNTGEQKTSTSSTGIDSGRVIVRNDTIYLTRNADITPANSYSDLFLDSAAVEQFIQQKKLSEQDAKSFRSFYNYRNMQFAWFTSLGFTEQAKGFWNMQDKFDDKTDKSLRKRMDTLLNMDTLIISRFDTSIVNTELALTNAYLQFYRTNRSKTLFANVSPEKAIPVKKENAVALTDSLLAQRIDSSSGNRSSSQYLALKQKLHYLQSKNMEVVSKSDTLPTIRQLPGKENPLGKVKFLFPNRYDIYFHDTNAKDIFKKDVRAVSHGCIRLADAEKMANYLLRNNSAWTPEKIHAAMNSGKQQYVKVNPAMPVTITYYTAWVDENGQLNFRDDVYGNDKKISQMMFGNYVMPSTTSANDSSVKK